MKKYIHAASASYAAAAKSMMDKIQLAQNSTDPKVLAQLADDSETSTRIGEAPYWNRVQWYIAENPNTPPDILRRLAESRFYDVRENVARNPNTPAEVREYLMNESQKATHREDSYESDDVVDDVASWPDAEYWETLDDDEDFDDAWVTYLSDAEDMVNEELSVFPEPSVQGGSGSMVLIDESGDNDDIYVDITDWEYNETEMAMNSASSEDYADNYRAYIESLISKAGWDR